MLKVSESKSSKASNANQVKVKSLKEPKKKKFKCEICDATRYSEKNIIRHMNTRHPKIKKNLICDYDGKIFHTKDNLRIHMQRHKKTEFLTCEICQTSYISSMTFRRHMLKHIEKFQCENCDKVFSSKSVYESHRAANHAEDSETSYQCNFCTRTFPSAILRNNHHYNAHKNNQPNLFRCHECNIDFEMKEELRIHSFIHFEGEIQTCLECHQIFKTKRLLNIHMQKHNGKQFACEKCGETFTFRNGLHKHQRLFRCKGPSNKIPNKLDDAEIVKIARKQIEMLSKRKRKIVPTEIVIDEQVQEFERNDFEEECEDVMEETVVEKNQEEIEKISRRTRAHLEYCCDFCGETIKYKNSMEQHMKQHMNSLNCKYKCDECPDVAFNNRKKLKSHYLEVHGLKIESVNERFVCGTCGRTFDTPSFYKTHLLSHTENYRPHICSVCSAAFKSVGNLRRHEATHAPSRDFVCSECSKSFKTKLALKIHTETVHVDLKVFVKCSVCGSILLEKNLKSHMKNQHTTEGQEKPFECVICQKTFKTEATAQRHFKSVHEPTDNGVVYVCDECPELKFFRKRDLREHSFTHFQGDVYQCHCGKIFKTKRILMVHQQTHKDEVFPCRICTDVVFKSKGGLRKHNTKCHTT